MGTFTEYKIGITALLLMLLLTACGGSGGGGYSTPPASSSSVSHSSVAPEASLQYLQATIFSPVCAQCHIGTGAPHGLRLNSEQLSYDNLVAVASEGVPTLLRVDPGDPDNSYLVRKLEGGPGIVGDRMPQGMAPLSSAQIALVRGWIANGAPREGTGDSATAMLLAGVELLGENTAFDFRFTRTLALDNVDVHSVQVFFINQHTRWLASPEQFALAADAATLRLTVFGVDVPVTALEIVVNDPATVVLLDSRGRVIDGDSDGEDGGQFRHVYRY